MDFAEQGVITDGRGVVTGKKWQARVGDCETVWKVCDLAYRRFFAVKSPLPLVPLSHHEWVGWVFDKFKRLTAREIAIQPNHSCKLIRRKVRNIRNRPSHSCQSTAD